MKELQELIVTSSNNITEKIEETKRELYSTIDEKYTDLTGLLTDIETTASIALPIK